MVSKFGKNVLIVSSIPREELEDHLSNFKKSLTIVEYMLESLSKEPGVTPRMNQTIGNIAEIVRDLQTKEADRYLEFYGIQR